MLRGLLATVIGTAIVAASGQAPGPAPAQLSAVTYTPVYPTVQAALAAHKPADTGDGAALHVYVQRTPERFEFREIQVRRTVGDNIEVISGLRDGDRIVVGGADKMPRP